MKFSTIQLGANKIEIFNSYLGKETITVNDQIVSEKSSITGAKHSFKIIENDQNVDCKIILGYGANGVVMDFYKDNVAIIQSPRSSALVFVLILAFLFVSVFLTVATFYS